jgi:hypothetical protein
VTPADRVCLQDAADELARSWSAELGALQRMPRLTWGPYSILPLEDVPLGVLLVHNRDPGEPKEVRAAIVHELEIRLADLLAWDRERRKQ